MAEFRCAIKCSFLCVLALGLLSGCGDGVKDRSYRNAKTVAPIKLPSGLDLEVGKDTLDIPEIQAAAVISDEELEMPPTMLQAVQENAVENEHSQPQALAVAQSPDAAVKAVKIKSVQLNQDEQGIPFLIVKAGSKTLWPAMEAWVKRLGFEVQDKNLANYSYELYKKLPTTRTDLIDKKLPPGEQPKPDAYERYQLYMLDIKDDETHLKLRDKEGREDGSPLAKHLLLQIKALMEDG